jgi:hypothetical protein
MTAPRNIKIRTAGNPVLFCAASGRNVASHRKWGESRFGRIRLSRIRMAETGGKSTPMAPVSPPRCIRGSVSSETPCPTKPVLRRSRYTALYVGTRHWHHVPASDTGIHPVAGARCGCPLRVRIGCVNRRVAHPRATLPRGARSRLHSETGPTWLCRSRPGAPSMSSVSVLPIRPGPRFALVFLLLKPEAVLYGHD